MSAQGSALRSRLRYSTVIEVSIHCLVFPPTLTYILSVNLLMLIREIHHHLGQNNSTRTEID